MRLLRLVAIALPAAVFLAAPAQAYDLPYDPYPWCAVYGGDYGGSNCGFSTLEQCRLTVSGIGGSCEPNQFYNPRHPAAPAHKRRPR